MWSKIVFSVWVLIIQIALGDAAETLDVWELMRNCETGNLEGVKQLVAKFGSKEVVEAQTQYDGHTCLFEASLLYPDLVSFLLENDADPNHKIKDGVTPLSAATGTCALSNVKQLLAHGADAKADYSQALYKLGDCRDDDETQGEIARLLLQHCANPDDDKPGREPGTPFMEAVAKAQIGSIRVMAEWMERVQINQDDIDPYYGDEFSVDIDDVRKAIAEGQEKRKMLLVYPFPAEAGEKLSLGPETLCAKAKICLQDRGGERRAA